MFFYNNDNNNAHLESDQEELIICFFFPIHYLRINLANVTCCGLFHWIMIIIFKQTEKKKNKKLTHKMRIK